MYLQSLYTPLHLPESRKAFSLQLAYHHIFHLVIHILTTTVEWHSWISLVSKTCFLSWAQMYAKVSG